ncbi:spermatogenesis-associated protein 17 isoform X3 [Numida meleagris]|uniref:spermatogenesis-associated protein 17 isoform X3 n=1 Tax=Numida meleagris TaxID=8996 RepID=UPI000B3E132C|nr:spermatogenesis-associated protein 17 isoform X3 [Numida meleagris]
MVAVASGGRGEYGRARPAGGEAVAAAGGVFPQEQVSMLVIYSIQDRQSHRKKTRRVNLLELLCNFLMRSFCLCFLAHFCTCFLLVLPNLTQDFDRSVDEDRKIAYKAAVKIQSWFRGCRVRAYLRYLNKMAISIQKWWRGYQSRRYFRKMIKIQKRWRGYYVRKYTHNYYALKKYLEAISLNNEIVRNELQEYTEMTEKEKKKKDLEKKEKEKKYKARKMHYLLSTEQIAGIYNSPFRKSPDPMELLLRQSKPLSHRRQQVRSPFTYELYDWPTCKRPPAFATGQPLPPIGKQKPQGPFRDTAEVLWQRYKPLEPTLRVAASINSPLEKAREEMKREEWRNCIHDNEFLPFSSYHKNEKYDLSIHASEKTGQETYGIKHFREVQPNKWIAGKDFQTVLPSIVLFEKFGKTYSKAGQIV